MDQQAHDACVLPGGSGSLPGAMHHTRSLTCAARTTPYTAAPPTVARPESADSTRWPAKAANGWVIGVATTRRYRGSSIGLQHARPCAAKPAEGNAAAERMRAATPPRSTATRPLDAVCSGSMCAHPRRL